MLIINFFVGKNLVFLEFTFLRNIKFFVKVPVLSDKMISSFPNWSFNPVCFTRVSLCYEFLPGISESLSIL